MILVAHQLSESWNVLGKENLGGLVGIQCGVPPHSNNGCIVCSRWLPNVGNSGLFVEYKCSWGSGYHEQDYWYLQFTPIPPTCSNN